MDTYADILVDGISMKRQLDQRWDATERFHFFQVADGVAMVIQNLQVLQLTEYLRRITNDITVLRLDAISSCHSHNEITTGYRAYLQGGTNTPQDGNCIIV